MLCIYVLFNLTIFILHLSFHNWCVRCFFFLVCVHCVSKNQVNLMCILLICSSIGENLKIFNINICGSKRKKNLKFYFVMQFVVVAVTHAVITKHIRFLVSSSGTFNSCKCTFDPSFLSSLIIRALFFLHLNCFSRRGRRCCK